MSHTTNAGFSRYGSTYILFLGLLRAWKNCRLTVKCYKTRKLFLLVRTEGTRAIEWVIQNKLPQLVPKWSWEFIAEMRYSYGRVTATPNCSINHTKLILLSTSKNIYLAPSIASNLSLQEISRGIVRLLLSMIENSDDGVFLPLITCCNMAGSASRSQIR